MWLGLKCRQLEYNCMTQIEKYFSEKPILFPSAVKVTSQLGEKVLIF